MKKLAFIFSVLLLCVSFNMPAQNNIEAICTQLLKELNRPEVIKGLEQDGMFSKVTVTRQGTIFTFSLTFADADIDFNDMTAEEKNSILASFGQGIVNGIAGNNEIMKLFADLGIKFKFVFKDRHGGVLTHVFDPAKV